MRHEADAAIAARDTALPGLAWLLDEPRLLIALRELPGLDEVIALQTGSLRYKPGVSCVAGWRLRRGDGSSFDLYGKALGAERFAEAGSRPRWRAARAVDPAAAPRCLPDARLLVLRPVDDRTLKGLRSLLAYSPCASLWRRLLPGFSGQPLLETLRYKPERRWVARVRDPRDGHDLAVLRACGADRFGSALAGAALGTSAGGARLLGASARLGLLTAEWLPGESLCVEARALPSAAELVRIGEMLAHLHALPVRPTGAESRKQEIERVRSALDLLCDVLPAVAQRAHALGDRCERLLASAVPRNAPVHGDFSLDQVVRDGDRLRLLDWDRAALGDPAGDLGSLWARLELQKIEGYVTHLDIEVAIDALCQGHDRASSSRSCAVAREAARLQAAARLLRLAAEPFRKRSDGWPAHCEALLERAADLLDDSRATRSSVGTIAAGIARSGSDGSSSGFFPALVRSLDAHAMQPRIVEALRLPDASAFAAPPELLRHKPGRRALVMYRLREPEGRETCVLAKVRAKGFDRRGYDVQCRLWRDGFDAAALSVPEPLAALPEDGMWLQRWVPGLAAGQCLQPGSDVEIGRRIARALAALHDLRLHCEHAWTIDDELHMLRCRLDEAAALRPALAARIGDLYVVCERLAEDLPAAATTGIHRDFYPDQVLVDGARITLLDFDLVAKGDPALDAGNFVAHLIELALRRYGDAQALDGHAIAFQREFLARSPKVAPAALHAYAGLSLARHVWLSTQFDERRGTTAALLELCERCIGAVAHETSRSAALAAR